MRVEEETYIHESISDGIKFVCTIDVKFKLLMARLEMENKYDRICKS